jgi:ankyrin repeat protein
MSAPALKEWQTAARADDVEAARQWLAAGRASEEKIAVSQLLHIAAAWGAANIVGLLLGSGAKVDSREKDGLRMTALMLASQGRSSGHQACVECLLEHGANPNTRARTGETVLSLAFLEAEYDKTPEARSVLKRIVGTLLQHGADASAPGASDAVVTAARLDTTDLLELLLDAGASASGVREVSRPDTADLQGLARDLRLDADELRKGAAQEAPSPLEMAILAKNVAAVRLLLERGANANDWLTKGRTPLLYAIENNAVDVLRTLVKRGANINAPQGKSRWTPLMWACFNNASADTVHALVEQGANVDAAVEGKTALSIAYVNGRRKLIDVLLTHGARERGFLGIILYPSAQSTDVQARLKASAGAVVANVLRNSAADVAGIQRDDAIVELAGQPVAGHGDLTQILSSRQAGERLRCIVVRHGERIEMPLELHPASLAERKYPDPGATGTMRRHPHQIVLDRSSL